MQCKDKSPNFGFKFSPTIKVSSIITNVARKIELRVGEPIFPDRSPPSARDREAIEVINKKILSELDRLREIASQKRC
jgi:hypothetical protein